MADDSFTVVHTPRGLRPTASPLSYPFDHDDWRSHASQSPHSSPKATYTEKKLKKKATPPKNTGPKTATQIVRGKVSKNKIRFEEDGFNLDLTYVKDRLIAMGFPSYGAESYYRNQIDEVERFFSQRHNGRYYVYNLCSERVYDTPSRFGGQHAHFPFDDHNPPIPITLIKEFCVHANAFLERHPGNVIATHCKAGKGRTGLMLSSLLLMQSCDPRTGVPTISAKQALDEFGNGRTKDGKGVTIPSQIRYVHYWEELLKYRGGEYPPEARRVRLGSFKVCSSVKDKGISDLYFTVTIGQPKGVRREVYDSRKHFIVKYSRRDDGFVFDLAAERSDPHVVLTGDVLFKVKKRGILGGDDNLFYFWINVDLEAERHERQGGGDAPSMKVKLAKHDIDKAVKDKSHDVYQRDLGVEIVMTATRREGSVYDLRDNLLTSPRSSPGSQPSSPSCRTTGPLATPYVYSGRLSLNNLGLNLPKGTSFLLSGVTMIIKIVGNDARQTDVKQPSEADTCVYVMWSDLEWKPLSIDAVDAAKLIVEIYDDANHLMGFKSLSLAEMLPPTGQWESTLVPTLPPLWKAGLNVDGDLEAYRALLFLQGHFEVTDQRRARPDTPPACRSPRERQLAAFSPASTASDLYSSHYPVRWGPRHTAAAVVAVAVMVAVAESRVNRLSSMRRVRSTHRRNAIATSMCAEMEDMATHIPRVASVHYSGACGTESDRGSPMSSPQLTTLSDPAAGSCPSSSRRLSRGKVTRKRSGAQAQVDAAAAAVMGFSDAQAMVGTFHVDYRMEKYALVGTCLVRYEETQSIDLSMLERLPNATGDRGISVVDALELRCRGVEERDHWLALMTAAAGGTPVAAQCQRGARLQLLVAEETAGREHITCEMIARAADMQHKHHVHVLHLAQIEAAHLARSVIQARHEGRRLEETVRDLKVSNNELTLRVQTEDDDMLMNARNSTDDAPPPQWAVDSDTDASTPMLPLTRKPAGCTVPSVREAASQTDVQPAIDVPPRSPSLLQVWQMRSPSASPRHGDPFSTSLYSEGFGRTAAMSSMLDPCAPAHIAAVAAALLAATAGHTQLHTAPPRTLPAPTHRPPLGIVEPAMPPPPGSDTPVRNTSLAPASCTKAAWDSRAGEVAKFRQYPGRSAEQQSRGELILSARVTRMAVNACLALQKTAHRTTLRRRFGTWQRWVLRRQRGRGLPASPSPRVAFAAPPLRANVNGFGAEASSVGSVDSPISRAAPSPRSPDRSCLKGMPVEVTPPPPRAAIDPRYCACPGGPPPSTGLARSPRGGKAQRCPSCWRLIGPVEWL
eukprot:TRINITY_DN13562_c0_g1_i1.p1 TRINITY_DN13562_c0_g1~~TRINITY_DN13562_c0_g1_i1.p1  ORF type:complete len:1304 (+),score=335.54 TRINITY_DN13562_c0_g1_i1:107-4018(+)